MKVVVIGALSTCLILIAGITFAGLLAKFAGWYFRLLGLI